MLHKLKQFLNRNLELSKVKPAEVINKVDDSRFKNLVEEINSYFSTDGVKREQYKNELDFINSKIAPVKGVEKILYAIIPYSFILDFDYNKVQVNRDEQAGMFYVFLNGKKLYYHKGFTNIEDVKRSFTFLLVEQHADSSHRYLDGSFSVNSNDTVVDLGAAEGNFSLMVVDKIKELIIVEADPIWKEALYKTFEPWKDKVTIINKFVGNTNDENTITLDSIQSKNTISVIKMDIEGAETSVLESAESFISENKIKMAVTTYHRQNDAADIKILLEKNNYKTEFSKGFMLFVTDKLTPPYFRKGLIKAYKL